MLEAVDGKVAGDAGGRTALNKLLVAVGKALGEAGEEVGGGEVEAGKEGGRVVEGGKVVGEMGEGGG